MNQTTRHLRQEGYVIVADGVESGQTVFLLDRAKQDRAWWSNRLDNVLVYQSLRVAHTKADSLKFNNPRVCTLAEAGRIAEEQSRRLAAESNEQMNDRALYESTGGWDDHKGWR